MADIVHPLPTTPRQARRTAVALVLALAVAAALIGGTLALWAHLGTAVFYEMIAAGIAYCL